MKKTIIVGVFLGFASMASASGSHEGGHHMEGGHWTAPKDAAQQVNTVHPGSDSIAKGVQLFTELCARCHGDQALGDGPDSSGLSVKPTNLQAMAGGHPDADFAWKIQNGRGEMPGWEDALEEEEIWHLVNFIQSLKEFPSGNHSSAEHGHD
jgi:mono/diheme cytochrome c family protein